MNATITASELTVGMFIGFLKIRQVSAVKQVSNGDVYFQYSTLGFPGKKIRMPAKQKIEVQIR